MNTRGKWVEEKYMHAHDAEGWQRVDIDEQKSIILHSLTLQYQTSNRTNS